MCMCGKPTINGTPGYSWDGKETHTRRVDPPAIEDRDELLFDEPGRCGGIDAHCHHYRIVLRYGQLFLLVRHGGGDERIPLYQCKDNLKALLLSMDSNARFWFMNSLYHTIHKHTAHAIAEVRREWSAAFVDKRIKKQKRKGTIRVWIEQVATQPENAGGELCDACLDDATISTEQLRSMLANHDEFELAIVRRQYAEIRTLLAEMGYPIDMQTLMAVVDHMASQDQYFVRLAQTVNKKLETRPIAKDSAASLFYNEHFTDASALMSALDKAGIESEQDWDAGSTTWTFDDGSSIVVWH